MYATIWPSIHGPSRTITTATPTIFGMQERLCSWIWVTAWKRLTTRPMTSADEQQRPGDLQRQAHGLGGEVDDGVLVHG